MLLAIFFNTRICLRTEKTHFQYFLLLIIITFSTFLHAAQVSFTSGDGLIIIDRGQKQGSFKEDDFICIHKDSRNGTKKACGVVVLTTNKMSIALIEPISDETVENGDQVIKHIFKSADKNKDPANLSEEDKLLQRVMKKEFSEKIIMLTDKNSIAMIKSGVDQGYGPGAEVCVIYEVKELFCGKVKMSNTKYSLLNVPADRRSLMKIGMTTILKKPGKSMEELLKEKGVDKDGKEGEGFSIEGADQSEIEKFRTLNQKLYNLVAVDKDKVEKQLKALEKRNKDLRRAIYRRKRLRDIHGFSTVYNLLPRAYYHYPKYNTIQVDNPDFINLWSKGRKQTKEYVGFAYSYFYEYRKDVFYQVDFRTQEFEPHYFSFPYDNFNGDQFVDGALKVKTFGFKMTYFNSYMSFGKNAKFGKLYWGLGLDTERSFMSFDSAIRDKGLFRNNLEEVKATSDIWSFLMTAMYRWKYIDYNLIAMLNILVPMYSKVGTYNIRTFTNPNQDTIESKAADLLQHQKSSAALEFIIMFGYSL